MSRRTEYTSAAAWAVFGVIVVVASWRLDRLESLGINPWSVPGLTPGVVGLLIVLLAIALALQARGHAQTGGGPAQDGRTGQDGNVEPDGGAQGEGSIGRTLAACALCLLFAGVSLGHGLPFVVEGAAFIFLFVTVFSWSQWRAAGNIPRKLLVTLVIAVFTSAAISWLFESVFLVRLP